MTGPTSVDVSKPNPTGEGGWLSDKAWAGILQLAKQLDAYKHFDLDFEKYISDWERIYNSKEPYSDNEIWPDRW